MPTKDEIAPISKSSFIMQASFVYVFMALAGVTIMRYAHQSVPSSFINQLNDPAMLSDFGIFVVLATAFLLTLSYAFRLWFSSYRFTMNYFISLFGSMPIYGLVLLAFLSSVGEEILFRGALQPSLGVFFTSILFGVLHIGPRGIGAWSLWAVIAGVILGLLYSQTQNILVPIVVHFLINLTSFIVISRTYLKKQRNKFAKYLDSKAISQTEESS